MITENIPNLIIHKLTKEQYQREKDAGRLDPNALYATPEDEIQIDDTLTFGGQAADARATGQAVSAIINDETYETLHGLLNTEIDNKDPYLTFIDELIATQIELAQSQQELNNIQAQLANTQSELANVLNTLFYKPGDVINVHMHTCGVLTASALKIYFTIPLNRPLKNVQSCIQDLTFQVRQNGTYYLGDANNWVRPDNFSFDLSDSNNLVGIIHFNSVPVGTVNNAAITVSTHGTITFQ